MSEVCKYCAKHGNKLAVFVLTLYTSLVLATELGVNAAGVGLDPAWADVQQRGVLRVATDIGWRPFADLRNGQVVGYDVDLARAVAARLGLRAEFVPTGFDALYDALTSRKADLVASALPYAPEQGERARFSEFYFNAGQVLVVGRDSPITGPGDLPGRRLGAALGSDADSLARRLFGQDQRVTLLNSYDEPAAVLADLARGRLDAAIVDNVAALTAAHNDTQLRIIDPALTLEPYVLAMPPNAFQLQAEVNRVLKQLRDEGFFAELNRRWLR
jgi:polar amino acid transport system substrate-binding protein